MPRPSDCERRFQETDYCRHGWASVALSSPMGLMMLAILMAGGVATVSPPRQAGAQTTIVTAVSPTADAPIMRETGRRVVTAADIRALVSDPAIRDFKGLAENAWDFTDPNGIPGFGPLLTPTGGFPVAQR